MTATTTPQEAPRRRAILLGRLSDNREEIDLTDEGIPLSLEDQVGRMRDRAAQLGWDVYKVIKNPRLSAYKRRKITLPDGRREFRVWRPDLREALADLWAGRASAMVCLDLDRAFRDPKDFQDLADLVEYADHPIMVESCTNSLHMEKGYDNFDAEIRVLVANKASRDTARRVSAVRERKARTGQYGGGRRPFGFCSGPPRLPDGGDPAEYVCAWHGARTCKAGITPITSEADVIADCSARLLQGVSLRALAAELRTNQVPSVTGAEWSAETLREVLLRARNAGQLIYKGKVVEGVAAPWEPIVDPEVFEAVKMLLTDKSRRKGPGAAPRWLGSGIYRCGVCTPPGSDTEDGKPMTCQVTLGGRAPRYRCKDHNHLTRNAGHVDDWVFVHIAYWLTHPRNYELLAPPPPEVDAPALRAERAAVAEMMKQYAVEEMLQKRTPAQVTAATKAGLARIGEIDELLNATVADDPLAEVVNAADPVAVWTKLPLADRRVLLDRLCTVTIMPAGRRGQGFDRSTVRVQAKHHLGAPVG